MGKKIKTILFVGKFIALFSSVVIVAHVISNRYNSWLDRAYDAALEKRSRA